MDFTTVQSLNLFASLAELNLGFNNPELFLNHPSDKISFRYCLSNLSFTLYGKTKLSPTVFL